MKFTLSWLKEHLDTTATLDEIVVGLTKLGLEVEGVEDPAADPGPEMTGVGEQQRQRAGVGGRPAPGPQQSDPHELPADGHAVSDRPAGP